MMSSSSSTSLVPPNNNKNINSNPYLSPALSYDQLLVPSLSTAHYTSTPNFALHHCNPTDHNSLREYIETLLTNSSPKQKMDGRRLSVYANFVGSTDGVVHTEQRRLSDGPHPPLLRRPLPYQYYHHPSEFGGSESCMLKRKNSSFNVLLDSTSSAMRTASSTFHCLIGSARRASYCGQPDPSIQLSPSGNSGSLYLNSTANESSPSPTSYDEQRRTVTIYDGRIPSTPTTPTIPFDLIEPIEAISQTLDDPVESFVQIVLETPDDRPPIIPLISPAPPRRDSSPRQRSRTGSPSSKAIHSRLVTPINSAPAKLEERKAIPYTELFDANHVHYPPPAVVEPMDFSFLEPVLRGESAAPPPSAIRTLPSSPSSARRISRQNSSTADDSAIDLCTPRSSCSSHKVTTVDGDNTSPESSPSYYRCHSPIIHITPPSRVKLPPSID